MRMRINFEIDIEDTKLEEFKALLATAEHKNLIKFYRVIDHWVEEKCDTCAHRCLSNNKWICTYKGDKETPTDNWCINYAEKCSFDQGYQTAEDELNELEEPDNLEGLEGKDQEYLDNEAAKYFELMNS